MAYQITSWRIKLTWLATCVANLASEQIRCTWLAAGSTGRHAREGRVGQHARAHVPAARLPYAAGCSELLDARSDVIRARYRQIT